VTEWEKTYFTLHEELRDSLMIQTVLCKALLLSLSEFTSLTVKVIIDVFYIRQWVRKKEVYEFVLYVQIKFHLTLFHQLLSQSSSHSFLFQDRLNKSLSCDEYVIICNHSVSVYVSWSEQNEAYLQILVFESDSQFAHHICISLYYVES